MASSVSVHAPDTLFPQSVSKFSLVYLLAWHPPLHAPHISSPNHCLLFATYAHTIATCFAVLPRLCHLILVCLNPLLGILSCSFMPHTHLTILISARWSATSFSCLTGHISLPCNTLLRTTAVQSPSHFQLYILIGMQWCQLPEFIPSNLDSVLHSCISISIHTQHVT